MHIQYALWYPWRSIVWICCKATYKYTPLVPTVRSDWSIYYNQSRWYVIAKCSSAMGVQGDVGKVWHSFLWAATIICEAILATLQIAAGCRTILSCQNLMYMTPKASQMFDVTEVDTEFIKCLRCSYSIICFETKDHLNQPSRAHVGSSEGRYISNPWDGESCIVAVTSGTLLRWLLHEWWSGNAWNASLVLYHTWLHRLWLTGVLYQPRRTWEPQGIKTAVMWHIRQQQVAPE
jgi:hypothetical protein